MTLTFVGLGCGGRTRTYCELAAQQPHRYKLVAAADPNAVRVEQVKGFSKNPEFRSFSSDKELFAAGKLADICIIGTQDAYHLEPCIEAMELGYDVLLEKPIATNAEDVTRLLAVAERLGRKVLVCHVLRYTPFYNKVKEIIERGDLGDVVTIEASEGVVPWHQAHSFVRGHWAVEGASTPMLLAKSCHDLDIISWLVDSPCTRVSSFGALNHFVSKNAPEGAPKRCSDGCPVGDTCIYNAMRYTSEHRGWLKWVMDGGLEASNEAIAEWLKESPWGRCVYLCDNDVVDHQVVAMEFEGGMTGNFTMTAFDSGRHLKVCGTKGTLLGGDAIHRHSGHDVIVQYHSGDTDYYGVSKGAGGYDGHGGGDPGLVNALEREFAKPVREMRSSIFASEESHLIGFAAEQSRHTGKTVTLEAFRDSLKS